jgi:glycosyltransferase involved in cell wall biosynthesis
VSDRVEFLGLVENMPRFWQSCDIAIFPSHQFIESFGMVALEAMACAKPVIATRNGGAPEVVIDGVTGTVVEPGDVAALERALVTYAGDADLRREHGAAGRARAMEKFDIHECARAYLRCFDVGA